MKRIAGIAPNYYFCKYTLVFKTKVNMQKNSSVNCEKVNEHIVNWLKTYAQNAKVNGFVIGISGGIDSAVTSTLCAQNSQSSLCT